MKSYVLAQKWLQGSARVESTVIDTDYVMIKYLDPLMTE